MRAKTTNQFIEDAKKVHGSKYDYSKVEYKNSNYKVCIICPKHGEFLQAPSNHLRGQGCRKCGQNTDYDAVEAKMKEIHNNRYHYDGTTYNGTHTKMRMICPVHGEFWKKPNSVLTKGRGCPKCNGGVKLTTEEFVEKARKIHGDKYDYSKVKYVNANTPVEIICIKHGSFNQKPCAHLNGHGCQLCGGSLPLNTEEFIKRSVIVHGGKYDYSKVEYVNNHTKVCIICPEHGEFWQRAEHHLNGIGCPYCNESHLERDTDLLLEKYGIAHERNKRFDWLGAQHLDFYLPEYNIAIECQGEQHYKPCTFGGISKEEAISNLEYIQKLDSRKKQLCENNNVCLEYINYDDDICSRIDEIVKNFGINTIC